MTDKQSSSVTLQMPDELLSRVDEHAERLGQQGFKVTRSDAIRNALDRGLREAERKVGVTRGERDGSSPKTKREA
jgi:metal-responsive CopG/Arc/MetJ family transcriptional regulator